MKQNNENIIKSILSEKIDKKSETTNGIKSKFQIISNIEGNLNQLPKEDTDKAVVRTIVKHALKAYERGTIIFSIFDTKISSKYKLADLIETFNSYGIALLSTNDNVIFQIYDEKLLHFMNNKPLVSDNREKAIEKLIVQFSSDIMLKISLGERIELKLVDSIEVENIYTKVKDTVDIMLLTVNEISTLVGILDKKYNVMINEDILVIDGVTY